MWYGLSSGTQSRTRNPQRRETSWSVPSGCDGNPYLRADVGGVCFGTYEFETEGLPPRSRDRSDPVGATTGVRKTSIRIQCRPTKKREPSTVTSRPSVLLIYFRRRSTSVCRQLLAALVVVSSRPTAPSDTGVMGLALSFRRAPAFASGRCG